MLLFLQRRFLQIMFNGLCIICGDDVNSDQSEVLSIMKKLISESFSEHKSVFYLSIILSISLLLFVVAVILLLSDPFSLKTTLKLIGTSFLEGLIFLYLLDEILWQVKGVERIAYDSNYLYIEKEGRLFNRYKSISRDNISDAYVRNVNPVWDFVCYITVTGNTHDKITILLKTGKKINCGWALDDRDCATVIENIRKLSQVSPDNEEAKSRTIKRGREIKSGSAKLVPHDEVMNKMTQQINTYED
jgi:hypothetical protein